jgi:hypothetical protein
MSKSGKGSQRAAKAAKTAVINIIRGAMAGPKGAAVAAAKELAPKLIKIVCILIVVLFLLPLMVFVSLPNILFGFPTSNSADIQTMTVKAVNLDAKYRDIDELLQEEVAKQVSELSAGYDDAQVDGDPVHINTYWFIAITSVYYQQNLDAIGDEQLREMVRKWLACSSVTESYTDDTGENEGDAEDNGEKTRVNIIIDTLDPYALMDELGFTDEQKNWALLLYVTMADDQTIREDDPFYVAGQDYGSITFTDGATEVVYYNQGDSRWGGLAYGKQGTIASSGCGPTALAIVVASLTDNKVTPDEVAKWAYENGYKAEGSGSYHSLIPEGGRHYGLTVEGIGRDGQKAADALASGKLIIAIMSKGHFTRAGHFIVLRGVTSEGQVLVADPSSVSRSQQEWEMKLILGEARKDAGAGGPLWVLSYP